MGNRVKARIQETGIAYSCPTVFIVEPVNEELVVEIDYTVVDSATRSRRQTGRHHDGQVGVYLTLLDIPT